MSNPFATTPAADAPEVVEETASVFETAPEAEEVEVDEADETYGTFDVPKQKPTEQATVPTKRLAQVVRQRNELRETVSEQQVRLAAAEARAETLAEFTAVIDKRYADSPDLMDFDAHFMSTFDVMAKTNPQLAQAAAIVKAAMEGRTAPVIDETPDSEGVEEAASNPVLDKIVARDVTRTVTDSLTEHGVKPYFIKAIATDVLATLDPAELADMTPEDVVEIAKVYLQSNDIPMSEFLTPKKGAPKTPPTSGGRGAPARAGAAETPDAPERTKPKTVEEWQEKRDARFKALTKDLGFGS